MAFLNRFEANYHVSNYLSSPEKDPDFVTKMHADLEALKTSDPEKLEKIAEQTDTALQVEAFAKAFIVLAIGALLLWGGIKGMKYMLDRDVPVLNVMKTASQKAREVCAGVFGAFSIAVGASLILMFPLHADHEERRAEARRAYAKTLLDECHPLLGQAQ